MNISELSQKCDGSHYLKRYLWTLQTKTTTEYDDKIWLATIEKATAYVDGRLVFTFKTALT
jgi:hypothetical protein